MGKGTIISHTGDGQYQVSVIYNVGRAQAEKTANLTKIANLEAQIAAEENEQKLNILKLQKLSLEKRNEILDNIPESETISAWCADLTEDLTGDVGLIEVPGESTAFNIQPGHEGNAAYNAARDGQLTPTLAMTPAAAFYNLAMLPSWQKWKPTYRYGTITAISGDTADVSLHVATSTQQGLSVNQESTLTGVPVEYMTCNGSAFESGDEVLVKFTGQDWANPVIVGFKDNPAACGFVFTLTRGDGTLLGDSHPSPFFEVRNKNGERVSFDQKFFNEETGKWHIILDPDDCLGEPGEKFYFWYSCFDGLKTLYPGKYKSSEGVEEAIPPEDSLISPGEYSDIIPYWSEMVTYPGAIGPWNPDTGELINPPICDPELAVVRDPVGPGYLMVPSGDTITQRVTVKSSIPYKVIYTAESTTVHAMYLYDYRTTWSTILEMPVSHMEDPNWCLEAWYQNPPGGPGYGRVSLTGGISTTIHQDTSSSNITNEELHEGDIDGANHELFFQDVTSETHLTGSSAIDNGGTYGPEPTRTYNAYHKSTLIYGPEKFTITAEYDY
jgi:hypothetical protein